MITFLIVAGGLIVIGLVILLSVSVPSTDDEMSIAEFKAFCDASGKKTK
jgi:hypothetical protein